MKQGWRLAIQDYMHVQPKENKQKREQALKMDIYDLQQKREHAPWTKMVDQTSLTKSAIICKTNRELLEYKITSIAATLQITQKDQQQMSQWPAYHSKRNPSMIGKHSPAADPQQTSTS